MLTIFSQSALLLTSVFNSKPVSQKHTPSSSHSILKLWIPFFSPLICVSALFALGPWMQTGQNLGALLVVLTSYWISKSYGFCSYSQNCSWNGERRFHINTTLSWSEHDISACPKLGTPFKGYKNCSKSAGRAVCTLKCPEGQSFDVDAETTFECGPDTKWRWNRKSKVKLPRCTSKWNVLFFS